jgi:hypothetical protein
MLCAGCGTNKQKGVLAMLDLVVRTFMSEQYTKLLHLCLELQDEELSSQEAAEKVLEITSDMRQWIFLTFLLVISFLLSTNFI